MRDRLYVEVREGPVPTEASGMPPTFVVTLGQRIILGRATVTGVADLISFDEPTVATRHASLEYGADGCWVNDLSSPCGIYVNWEAVSRKCLKPGDRLSVGKVVLVIHADRPDVTNRSYGEWMELLRREGLSNRGRYGLERIGARALADLTKMLEDSAPSARQNAADALGALGPKASSSVPSLITSLRDTQVRQAAAAALANIGRSDQSVVMALIAELERKEADESHPVRLAADIARRELVVWTIGQIGPAAEVAVPSLLEADRSGDFDLGGATQRALKLVRGETDFDKRHDWQRRGRSRRRR